jgi:hypothetical protein
MLRLIKFAAFMLLAVLCIDAAFGQVKYVGVHGVSAHLVSRGLNNVNPGVYVWMHNGMSAGVYYNSYRQWVRYAAYSHDITTYTFGQLTLTVGVVHGYDQRELLPMLAVSKRFDLAGVHGVRAAAALPEVLHLSYEYEVK